MHTSSKTILLPSLVLGLGLAGVAAVHSAPAAPPAASQPTAAQVRFFETSVRPVLAEKCFACHGPARQSGGLRLDSRAALLAGGGAGAAVVPGHPEQSLLVQAINHSGLKMPPTGKLKPAEIQALTEWVKQGAPWPGAPAGVKSASRPRGVITEADRAWWAFQPVRRPPVPSSGEGWARNPIDRFIMARLEREGLKPSPEADPRTLIRRVTFDLTGLPPTPEEVEAFVKECADEKARAAASSHNAQHLTPNTQHPTPDPYSRLVDRLLASPRYGEKWARHWLDLVRYADSDGYRADEYRPHAWRYRDYVIRSFNEDKRYDRFVQEQLAGDELFPGRPEALIATGYLRHWIYEWNQRDVRGQWTTILNDITDTTGDVFLGMGVQCARCHDHKFDPILQKDYYRLQAFFAPIMPRDDLVAATEPEKQAYRERIAIWESKTAEIRRQIEEIEGRYRPPAARGAIEMFPPDIQEMINKPVPQRSPLEHQLAELAYRQVYYEYDRLDQKIKGEDKERLVALRKQLAAFDKEKPEPLPVAFTATDVGPGAPPVLIPKKGKEPVEPGFLSVLDPAPAKIEPLPAVPGSTGRRAVLARWLTRPENPLTGRVLVNRVWQWHFGRGLAANSSDFGKLGEKPSHPELLDWMASWFTESGTASKRHGSMGVREYGSKNASPTAQGQTLNAQTAPPGANWSLKALHRLIVTSATYRQRADVLPQSSSVAGTDPRVKDPENRLYWRANTRRLDAEQIRDTILAVTGELDLKAGGPGVTGAEPRRTIYTRFMRNNRDPLLDVFDLPQFFSSASSRDTTTTPVQSLLLINSQQMLVRAKTLAERLERETGGDREQAVTLAYRLTYGRSPSADETRAALRFLEEQTRRINPEEAGSAAAAFLHDKLPYRDGQAAILSPEGPQRGFEVPASAKLPAGEFTIEAFVLPRSVYETGAVRTVAARWDGNTKSPGWAFGITGKGSRRKPQTLVLQLIGRKADGTFGEEAIFSDHHLQMNKPYYVAASVKLAAAGAPGSVTFYLKDLSNDDEPLLSAVIPHRVTGGIANSLPLTLGGRGANRDAFFDGLVDDVRLSDKALGVQQLLFTAEGTNRHTVGYWQFEAKPDAFRDMSGNGLDIRVSVKSGPAVDPRRAALADFCHVLLNSSELLYVD